MNTTEKMILLFDIIDASNSEIAKRGGVDPSLVSRYRAGTRLPSSTSKNFEKLCAGIVSCAVQKNLWNKLTRLCQLPNEKSPEQSIMRFLLPLDSEENLVADNKSAIQMSFGEKVKLLMDLLDISNVMLAKALNVDTSLISRIKNGKRIPLKNSVFVENMCLYFHKKLKAARLPDDAIKLLNIPIDTQSFGNEVSMKSLSQWLLADTCIPNFHIIDQFIKKMETSKNFPLEASTSFSDSSHQSLMEAPLYIRHQGIDGFMSAIIYLFKKIIATKKAHTIHIYSDQSIEWMLASNSPLIDSCTAIVYQLLQNNCQIKIIHNIERSAEELLLGLEKWLPLYNTGLVEGYYSNSSTSTRFSHTLFYVKDVACIVASNVVKTEDNGIYVYSELPEDISHTGIQFNALFEQAKPLIQVYTHDNINNYLYLRSKLCGKNGTIKDLISSPPVYTMPLNLAEGVIKRIDSIRPVEADAIIEQCKFLRNHLDVALEHNTITHYMYLPTVDEIKAGKVYINLSDLFIGEMVPYSYEEYREHIKLLMALLQHENYNIVPLAASPMGNIRITARNANGTSIYYQPSSSLYIHHPHMSKVVHEYLDNIVERYRLPFYSKTQIIKFLETYVN